MKHLLLLLLLGIATFANAQRGNTGDKTYKNKFPYGITQSSNSDISVQNATGEDIILVWKTALGNYINHAYIRSGDTYKFTNLPTGNMQYFFKSKNSFYKDEDYTNVQSNYGYSLKLFKSYSGGNSMDTSNKNEFFN